MIIRRLKILTLVIPLLAASFFVFIFSVLNANAEGCGNRNVLGHNDIFWGNPPPNNVYQPSPRDYPNVSATTGDTVRLSMEGEYWAYPGETSCTGRIAEFEIYRDGSLTPIRYIKGPLSQGPRPVIPGNLGTWSGYVDGPHDLYDGSYRFRVIKISGITINSYISPNLLTIVNAGASPPLASCIADFSPASVNLSQSSTLAWSSSNDFDKALQYSCTGNIGSGFTTESGSTVVNPITSQTCTFTAINEDNIPATCSASVTVIQPPPASCNVSFSPATITSGQSTNQTWSSTNDADGNLSYTCTGNLGSGTVSATGSRSVVPAGTQTCTLTAINAAGVSNSCSSLITVNAPPQPTANITCNGLVGSCSIAYNTSANISWSSSNTTSCSVGAWSGTSGGPQSTGNLLSNQTYTIVCNGPGGSASASVIVNVGVQPPPPPPPPPPPVPSANILCNGAVGSCSVIAGSPVTISWSCFNASSAMVTNNVDSTTWSGLSGSQLVPSVSTSVTYSLTCNGISSSAKAIVSVYTAPPPPPPPPPPQPESWIFSIPNPFGGQIDTFDQLFGAILLFLYYLVAPIVVIMIILAGLLFLIGRGEPSKVQTAKKILLYAIIGLVIVLIGSGFIALLKSIFALGG